MQAWAEWDLPSIKVQLRYWRRHPPVHQLVAAYLDYKPRAGDDAPRASSQACNDANVEALMGATPDLPEHLRSNIPNPYAKRAPYG